MYSRRSFLKATAASATMAGLPRFVRNWKDTGARKQHLSIGSQSGRAYDSDPFWRSIQESFSIDRSVVHLNNGGVGPAPISVQLAETNHLKDGHRQPFYAYTSRVSPQIELIRKQLGDYLGCDQEELAFTRNTSEGMEIVQFGLKLRTGDEIVTTTHDYPRMLQTWEQRAMRDGIIIKKVDIPVPLTNTADFVDSLTSQITDRTRLVMCCHMVDLTGQILPIRSICDAAHDNGVPVLVDGAQTPGHLPFSLSELDCDFFATSLHKWTMGPQGTGCLFVKRPLISKVDSLMSSSVSETDNIRKFEDIGTSPPAKILALAEALAFHQSIGSTTKEKRLIELRNYWLDGVLRFDRVALKTNTTLAGAMATIHIDGIDPVQLRNHLWDQFRIRVRPIRHESVSGIRISASIYNTKSELDYLVEALAPIIRHGLPLLT